MERTNLRREGRLLPAKYLCVNPYIVVVAVAAAVVIVVVVVVVVVFIMHPSFRATVDCR
jgi:hypothetical protein